MKRLLFSAMAALVLLLTAAPAQAEPDPEYWSKLTTAQQHTLINYYYMGGAQEPPFPEQEKAAEGFLYDLYEPPELALLTSPEEREFFETKRQIMAQKAYEDRARAELSSGDPKAIGKYLVAIGSGVTLNLAIEGVFPVELEVGLPQGALDVESGGACYTEECGGGLTYQEQGREIYGEAKVVQSPGAYLLEGEMKGNHEPLIYFWEPPCVLSDYSEPKGAHLQGGLGTGFLCWNFKSELVLGSMAYPYFETSDLYRIAYPHPSESKSGVKTISAVEAPDQEEAEAAIAEAVNEDEETQAYTDHELYPELFPDPRIPRTRVDEKHDCDRSPGALYKNPYGFNVSPEPYAKKEETPFSVTTTPSEESPAVYLRWGRAEWQPEVEPTEYEPITKVPRYLDHWNGFGFRHIKAKHGWSELDRTETQQALTKDVFPEENVSSGNWVYQDVVTGGCIRNVVVDFTSVGGNPARGIVTSFNVP